MEIINLGDLVQIKQEPESLKSGNNKENGHPYSTISSTNQQPLEENGISSKSSKSSLTRSINFESEIGKEKSFDFKTAQYWPDARNKSRPNPEEASTENETSNIFDDVTTNNLVSFKKKRSYENP